MFERCSQLWGLIADGDPITTPTATLFPVLWRDRPAMLKLSSQEDQQRGAGLMEWWNGDGAARVFARDKDALLMERTTGSRSLAEMARNGRDDESCRILCATAAKLHADRPGALPDLVPLARWFRDLEPAAVKHGGILLRCADTARMLLADPRDRMVLHGDLHHDNVLDFGPRGWCAIDPHGLIGERGFDFANIFTNPDLSDPSLKVMERNTQEVRDYFAGASPEKGLDPLWAMLKDLIAGMGDGAGTEGYLLLLWGDVQEPSLRALAAERNRLVLKAIEARLPAGPRQPEHTAGLIQTVIQGSCMQWLVEPEGELAAFMTKRTHMLLSVLYPDHVFG